MLTELLKSKIHRATITDTNAEYEGSLTIDSDLMEAAGIREFEMVRVAVIDTGVRFATYAMRGEAGSGEICANGAAARLVERGQKAIIMSFAHYSEDEAGAHLPTIVKVDSANRPQR
jgi:aspartate 1-decarboxylase